MPSLTLVVADRSAAPCTPRFSLRLDSQLLDDRPPFLGIGLLQSAKRLRRLLFAWENLVPDIDEARSHSGIGKGRDRRCIELSDDIS